jgi:hypothetical protein
MVIDGTTYILARSGGGRPTCQHKLHLRDGGRTACGYPLHDWSVEYTKQRFDVILCRTKACHE